MRLGAFFVAFCMTVIAASAGAVAVFGFAVPVTDAFIIAIATLTGLALYNAASTKFNAGAAAVPQIADLARGTADLARQVAEQGRRLAALEARPERAASAGEGLTAPLAVEISELGTLMNQLAETVAGHEAQLKAQLKEIERVKAERIRAERFKVESIKPPTAVKAGPAVVPQAPPVPAPPRPEPAAAAPSQPPVVPALPVPELAVPATPAAAAAIAIAETGATVAVVAPAAPGAEKPVAGPVTDPEPAPERDMAAIIREALESNRIDLFLQPIVTLPQRKVRYYEATTRLRTRDGEVVPASQFAAQAELGGLMPRIDNLVIFRCVQVLRRLLLKNREVGVFCNLSTATLADAAMFRQLVEFLDANRAIASALVLEFNQSGLRTAGPIESESLAALKELGYSFSMDNVTDLRLLPRELAGRGFRFVKLPASLILNRSAAAADIHPADFPDLLGRFGIGLIAEKIESESVVVDLLDHDVKFGQGFLFSPPRPVRAEALQGIAERSEVIAREPVAGPFEASALALAAGANTHIRAPAPPAKGARPTGLARIARRL
jgi:cyclic-di-GMP phosphodiesterase TipF (flagellum assembly factor)